MGCRDDRRPSAWGPGHWAAAQDVKVQMIDGLAAMLIGVGDDSKSVFRKAEVFGDFAGSDHQMSEKA